jgi:glycogen(starch) synthase
MHPRLRVVISRDGPFKPELQDEVRDRRLQRGQLHRVPRRRPAARRARRDGHRRGAEDQPFGMVALEAAAAGAPIAVAQTGGLTEIVEPGVTGMTFPAKDPDSLADAVSTLLADDDLADKVAREARRMVAERYGWGTVA